MTGSPGAALLTSSMSRRVSSSSGSHSPTASAPAERALRAISPTGRPPNQVKCIEWISAMSLICFAPIRATRVQRLSIAQGLFADGRVAAFGRKRGPGQRAEVDHAQDDLLPAQILEHAHYAPRRLLPTPSRC